MLSLPPACCAAPQSDSQVAPIPIVEPPTGSDDSDSGAEAQPLDAFGGTAVATWVDCGECGTVIDTFG
jgi:hypothetical protein